MKNNLPLAFYPLSILHDGPDSMVGRADKESYAYFPEDAIALLQQLQLGMCPNQAAIWYEQQYGETVDIEDFLITLRDLQFIWEESEHAPPIDKDTPVSLQRLGRATFSPLAWIIYSLLFGLCVYAMLRYPVLIPKRDDLFFSPSLVLITVALLLFQILAVLFHECYHTLAGRRLGLPTRITIGHRLGALTLETSLTCLWTVPRRLRYLPLLAGMLADVIVFSLCIVTAWIIMTVTRTISPLGTFCLAMAYATALRFLWQFSFYLRTDLYYVIITALRCIDLHNTVHAYIRNLFFTLLRRTDKLENEMQWHSQDRKVVRWYAFVYLGGYGISIGLIIFVGLPLTIQLLGAMITHLLQGAYANPSSFFDAAIFLTLNLISWIVLIASIVRKIGHWRKQSREAQESLMPRLIP